MGKTLTKEKLIAALEECYDHWVWLSEHPTKNKSDYKPSKKWVCYCRLCKLHDDFSAFSCRYCNNIMKWTVKVTKFHCECENKDSLYTSWQLFKDNGTNQEAGVIALQISLMLLWAIKKVKKEGVEAFNC